MVKGDLMRIIKSFFLLFLLGTVFFSSNTLADDVFRACQITMLPVSNSQHLNVLNKPANSVVGQVTLKYKVVCDSDGVHKTLVSRWLGI